MLAGAHPILTGAETKTLETRLFAGDEGREGAAMTQAGRALGAALLRDFRELGAFPPDARLLVLVGKGHNGGDALIAATFLAARHPGVQVDVVFVLGSRRLRPLAARAWRDLVHAAPGRVHELPPSRVGAPAAHDGPAGGPGYAVALDGLFGFRFCPPLAPAVAALLARVNALEVRLRAAVDLPSGLDEPDAFRADFTYATGVVKTPVLTARNAGRVRYLDLGFFTPHSPAAAIAPGPAASSVSALASPSRSMAASAAPAPATAQAAAPTAPESADYILTDAVLAPLRRLRAPHSDKRTYGHLFVLGGSRSYPGAVLMCVRAALRSGVGLLTAFVPASLVPAYAAAVPEAMWVGWPETPDGNLALEGRHLWHERLARASALVLGPGLGREAETLTLAQDCVAQAPVPLVLDADALQPAIVRAGSQVRVLTPHAGEFARIAGGEDRALRTFLAAPAARSTTVVLKGPLTQLAGPAAPGVVFHSPHGGPVLARGGSGDMLAGLLGGLLAQTPGDPLGAAARAVVWHGLAADQLARSHGQVAVNATQLLDFLAPALRDEGP